MSFRESIIIPLTLFKKCKLDEIDAQHSDGSNILINPAVDSSKKIKLYQQERILKRRKIIPIQTATVTLSPRLIDQLLSGVPPRFVPYGKSIIDFIKSHEDEIGWDKDYHIRINSNIIPNSDLMKSLQHLMKNTVITKESDTPPGTYELLQKLIELGMPKTWVPSKLAIQRTTRGTSNGSKYWVRW